MIIYVLLLLLHLPLCAIQQKSADWTWLHHETLTQQTRAGNAHKKSLLFSSQAAPFTQLIFSWNASRPDKGYFSFYVQVRDAVTKKWGNWHHMADWGAGVQRSYVSKSDGFSSFVHVRLEVDDKKVADAWKIKLESHDVIHLSRFHGFAVAVSNFNLFKPEDGNLIGKNMRSVFLTGVPTIAQLAVEHEENHRLCSPTSCAMMVQYLTGQPVDSALFAAGVFDTGLSVYGSWPYNVAHAFDYCKGRIDFLVRRFNSFADIHQQLQKGIPVTVSVRGTLPGALKTFPHGHLMVVVGWDSDTREVLCHDPAAESDDMVFKRYPLADFLRAWEASHRLVYVADGNI